MSSHRPARRTSRYAITLMNRVMEAMEEGDKAKAKKLRKDLMGYVAVLERKHAALQRQLGKEPPVAPPDMTPPPPPPPPPPHGAHRI